MQKRTSRSCYMGRRYIDCRAILDSKYGLKRWQIGEIASKIGQLYYHYYLRTSETSYLHEAFSFYAAIRGRAYYSRAAKEDRSDLMVKKLRFDSLSSFYHTLTRTHALL